MALDENDLDCSGSDLNSGLPPSNPWSILEAVGPTL
jgi:hypothetical protein